MRLKNKKTGEIGEVIISVDGDYYVVSPNKFCEFYDSATELAKDWEEYEEPKEYWYIEADGSIIQNHKPTYINHLLDGLKSIGNYFESEEEAEKAVEKLKAWKRLKDKGFRFTGVAGISNNIYVSFETDSEYEAGHVMYDEHSNTDNNLREYNQDLMLLFGGEE